MRPQGSLGFEPPSSFLLKIYNLTWQINVFSTITVFAAILPTRKLVITVAR